MTLVATLESLARDTWERLRDATALEINFGEETITDLLLLDLKRMHPPRSQVIQTPKSKEKDQGTDWEWWIGSSRSHWIRLAVQAKKLHLASGRYAGFAHKVGTTLQIDLLERYAKANDAISMYCLYNYVNATDSRDAWRCCQPTVDPPQLACTITPSSVVRRALATRGGKTFLKLHSREETIPWRCLASCPKLRDLYRPTRGMATDEAASRLSSERQIRHYDRLPPEIEQGRSSGSIRGFSREFYDATVGLYPRRVTVLEFAPEEDPPIDQ